MFNRRPRGEEMGVRGTPGRQVFYGNSPLYFGILLIVAFVGFFPSFYGRIGEANTVHQFHGAVSTLWMLLRIARDGSCARAAWVCTALHARFMVCTALPLIPPALGRALHMFLPGMSFAQGFHACFIVTELIVLGLLYHDSRTGKVRAPYLILLAMLPVQHASFAYAMRFGPWRDVVAWIASL